MMKRNLGVLLVLLLPGLACGESVALGDSVSVSRAAEQGLGRTWMKLDQEKKLTIGYFGGSITVGAGASKMNLTSWRALTTAWFKQQFPSAQITEVSAAIGGTGSNLGVYRCETDLLSKHPDLIFVEFSVNDHGFPKDAEIRWTEGIVRQIRRSNPAADIVFVYTTGKAFETYSKGSAPNTVLWQQEVADHYGIPSVNVGKALCQAIMDGKGTWETLTKDGTHPLDAGYEIYAHTIADFLRSHRKDTPARPVSPLPAPVSAHPIDTVQKIDAWTITASGWTREDQTMAGRYPHQLTSNVPGASFDFPFHGSGIGLYWLMSPDGGTIEYSVDDEPSKSLSNWAKSPHAKYSILRDCLPAGDHVLHVKVSANKDSQSSGNWIRLGALIVL